MNVLPSAVEPFAFRGRHYFIKRDDAIDPLLSGNKYRKLFSLLQTPPECYAKIVSYGGTQSNAMLSIAALCRRKGWAFDYYAKPLSKTLRTHPSGNLKMALDLGMNLVETLHEDYRATVEALHGTVDPHVFVVPQGGADAAAREGIDVLAAEIGAWRLQNEIETLSVVTPSGTGTTAAGLARALGGVNVITTAVVGDADYLREQIEMLGVFPSNLTIIGSHATHHFAKPHAELYEVYAQLREAGLEVDLIYGAKMWFELLRRDITGTVLYVHSGGLIGNETMLERYRYKGLL